MKSNEWYTPARYIEAARQVMGTIDLDPASSQLANETVRATRYFDKEQDGLSQQWHGNIWLNPPYGLVNNKSGVAIWMKKAKKEYKEHNISSIICLLPAGVGRKWFADLWAYTICFADHQILFNCIDAKSSHIYDANCFIYLGSNEQKFIQIFSEFGPIVRKVSP